MADDPEDFWDTSGETAMGTSGNVDAGLFDTGTGTGGGVDWGKIGAALQTLGKSDASTAASNSGKINQSSGVIGQSSSQVGRPTAAVSLDNLMKILQARQQGYATSAMSPQSAQPQTQQRTSYGLLGY